MKQGAALIGKLNDFLLSTFAVFNDEILPFIHQEAAAESAQLI